MKVQIQYHIDVDEVPNKISQLVEEALNDLKSQIETMSALNKLCKQASHLEAVESGIDALRKQLALSDTSLADAHSICSGLIRHLNPAPPTNMPSAVPAQEPALAEEPVEPVEKK